MNENKLVRTYRQLLSDFDTHLIKVAETMQQEDIHQLRLVMKKEKALLHLAEFIGGNAVDPQEQLLILSLLFSTSGDVRSAQLNFKLVSKYKKDFLNPFQENQENIEAQSTEEMLGQISWIRKQDLSAQNEDLLQKMSAIPNRIIKQEAWRYLCGKIGEVTMLVGSGNWNENLHKIRKLIKTVDQVVLMMFEKKAAKAPLKPFVKSFKKLDEKIGEWHDYLELGNSLRYFYQQGKYNEYALSCGKIIGKLAGKTEALQYGIVKILESKITPEKLASLENAR